MKMCTADNSVWAPPEAGPETRILKQVLQEIWAVKGGQWTRFLQESLGHEGCWWGDSTAKSSNGPLTEREGMAWLQAAASLSGVMTF